MAMMPCMQLPAKESALFKLMLGSCSQFSGLLDTDASIGPVPSGLSSDGSTDPGQQGNSQLLRLDRHPIPIFLGSLETHRPKASRK
ncbi:rCG20378 [Rattus norvegicus]|uniref:RCG20378 n=1 Tax=Rattus norvegicus TaxID=10116 RepID=A6JG10_RAT|nr:rCG20378 [Rattus norvegicus]